MPYFILFLKNIYLAASGLSYGMQDPRCTGFRGMWDLSSLTRDHTHVPCIAWQSLNQWSTRQVPQLHFTFLLSAPLQGWW